MKNTKGTFVIALYRLSAFFSRSAVLKIIGLPVRVIYKILIQWVFGIQIPDDTVIGSGFQLYHGQGLVVHSKTVIGKNVTLRHTTTIGNAISGGKSPVIRDNVQIGAHCVILGDICIGENAIIGAGSVVTKDVPPNAVVVGNPAKILKYRQTS